MDGHRTFEMVNGYWGSPLGAVGLANLGYSECEDTLAGIAYRFITAYWPSFPAYAVVGVPVESARSRREDTEALICKSPDSLDQRLFLAVLRTARRDIPSGLNPVRGNEPPTLLVPSEASMTEGIPSDLTVSVTDPDPRDSLRVSVQGLPPGLQAVVGRQEGGRVDVRLYGIPNPGTYQVKWSASDGNSNQTASSRIHVRLSPQSDIEEQVVAVATARGMSKRRARALGSAALPILTRLLRSEKHRRHWPQIASAIGAVGDTAYFDTLRAFVWNRFQGPVDERTFQAIHIAQASLAPIATVMPRAMEYLSSTSIESSWNSIPWKVAGSSQPIVANLMVRETLVALAYTDSERAGEIIGAWCDQIMASLPASPTTADPGNLYLSIFARGLRSTHARVRARGFVREWEDQEHGGH